MICNFVYDVTQRILFNFQKKYIKKPADILWPKDETLSRIKKFNADKAKRLRPRIVIFDEGTKITKKMLTKLNGIEELYVTPSTVSINKNLLIEHCTNSRYIT